MTVSATSVPMPSPLPRKAWLGLAALFFIGIALRIGWIIVIPPEPFAGEARNVAVSLATNGVFGDAFYPGQGPTAHLTPTSPAIAGAIFALFGVDSIASNLALTAWCFLQVFGSFFLLTLLFRRLGTPYIGLMLALAALCLLPVYIGNETVTFRYWEGALAVNLAAGVLLILVSLEGRGDPGWRWMVGTGALAAFTMFVSPTLGLGVYVSAGFYLWRNLRLARIALAVLIAAAALATLVVPWAIRNERVMGAPVLLRDNSGMQLAVANYPEAVHSTDLHATYEARLKQVQPFFNPALRTAMEAAGGEVQYSKKLGRETKQWICQHPHDFIQLTMRHFTEFYWPRGWEFHHSGSGKFATQRGLIVLTASIFAFIGLAIAIWRKRPGYIYLVPMILLPGLTYSVFQPLPRYTYLIYGMLVFLAADCLARFLVRRPSIASLAERAK